MTNKQLSDASGVSTSYLTQLESSGEAVIRAPGAEKLSALAAALGTTMDYLATGKGVAPSAKAPRKAKAPKSRRRKAS